MITIVDCAYTIRDDGPPLFLIHEIGASYETWAKTLPVLTPHFNVITYYLCGHGASPKSYGEFSLNELVADLETFRNQLEVTRAHCPWHSLGGMIGPSYSRLYKNYVLSLNLLSTPAFRNAKYSAKIGM